MFFTYRIFFLLLKSTLKLHMDLYTNVLLWVHYIHHCRRIFFFILNTGSVRIFKHMFHSLIREADIISFILCTNRMNIWHKTIVIYYCGTIFFNWEPNFGCKHPLLKLDSDGHQLSDYFKCLNKKLHLIYKKANIYVMIHASLWQIYVFKEKLMLTNDIVNKLILFN